MGDLNGYIKNTYQSQGMPQDIVLHFLGQLGKFSLFECDKMG